MYTPHGPIDPLQNYRELGLAPIRTSVGLGWRGTEAECFRHSPREIEQPSFRDHLITHMPELVRFERHHDGGVDRGYHAPGNVGLIPAGGPAARWILEGERDALYLSLDPAVVEGVAEEIGADGAELLGFGAARNEQIERLALPLKAELEAGGAAPGDRLYAESLTNALAVHLLREHSSLSEREAPTASPLGASSPGAACVGPSTTSAISLPGGVGCDARRHRSRPNRPGLCPDRGV